MECLMKRLLFSFFFIYLFAFANLSLSAALTVDDFMADPELFDMDISPNGRYLAEVRQEGKFRIVIIRDLTTPNLSIVGKVGDDIMRPYSVLWANDDRLIVHLLVPYNTKHVRREAESEEDFDIDNHFMMSRSIAVDITGKNSAVLMHNVRALRWQTNLSRIRHLLPNDHQHILMSSFDDDRLSLYKVNIYDGTATKVIAGGTRTIYFICETEGNPRYRVDYFKSSNAYKILELTTDNEWEQVDQINFDRDEKDSIDPHGLVGLSLQGQLLYRKKNERTGFYEVIEKKRGSNSTQVIASIVNHDVTGLIYAYGNDRVIGYIYEEDNFINKYFDPDQQKNYDNIRNSLDGYGFHIVSNDKANNNAIIQAYGPDLPAAYYLYNRTKDSLTFYDEAYSRLKSSDLGKGATVTFLSRDNARIRMYLILPPGYEPGKKYPLVVMPHGGPQARDYITYDDFAAFIASQGYLVARPNFRGSTGYGLEFEKAGYKQWGGIMQDDLQDAAQFLIRKGFAKEGNICLVGGSYGGYAALMGLIKHQSFYRCAVSVNGVTHLRDQLKFDEKRFKEHPETIGLLYESIGNPKTDAALLDANSPLLQAAKINAPVLLIAGTRDEVVPFKQSKAMFKTLSKTKKSVEWVPLKDTYHNAWYYEEDRKTIYEKVGTFLAKHLN